ncbi:hypothetical protein LTR85_006348 [Meristemomyces frigidus]|nr:hypothetical protein LTR85_006348 [Meristemomyces frigidus]
MPEPRFGSSSMASTVQGRHDGRHRQLPQDHDTGRARPSQRPRSRAKVARKLKKAKAKSKSGICKYLNCSKTFDDPADYHAHLRTHKPRVIRPYACPQCSAEFIWPKALRRHQDGVHRVFGTPKREANTAYKKRRSQQQRKRQMVLEGVLGELDCPKVTTSVDDTPQDGFSNDHGNDGSGEAQVPVKKSDMLQAAKNAIVAFVTA